MTSSELDRLLERYEDFVARYLYEMSDAPEIQHMTIADGLKYLALSIASHKEREVVVDFPMRRVVN